MYTNWIYELKFNNKETKTSTIVVYLEDIQIVESNEHASSLVCQFVNFITFKCFEVNISINEFLSLRSVLLKTIRL